jgi:glycosyltransferase involved in cell wall biosynthesis
MAEKVLDLLADEDWRAEMGRCGRSRIEKELAWEHQKQNLLAAYEALQR